MIDVAIVLGVCLIGGAIGYGLVRLVSNKYDAQR
jgi:hypothetical protein